METRKRSGPNKNPVVFHEQVSMAGSNQEISITEFQVGLLSLGFSKKSIPQGTLDLPPSLRSSCVLGATGKHPAPIVGLIGLVEPDDQLQQLSHYRYERLSRLCQLCCVKPTVA